MRSRSLLSLRPLVQMMVATAAVTPLLLVACEQPSSPNAVPDAAPVAPPVVTATAAVPTAPTPVTPIAPLATGGGSVPAAPGVPGHAHHDGGAAASGTASGGPAAPTTGPFGLPPIPTNLTLPTAFPSGLTLPSNLPNLVPPTPTASARP